MMGYSHADERGPLVRENGLMLPRIELLADEGSLDRGRDYFRRGRVLRVTTQPDGSVEGVVEGKHFYRVRLLARSWECDCPMGVSGVFCKHCVAVALAAAAEAAGTSLVDDSGRPRSAQVPAAAAGLADAKKQTLSAFRSRRNFYDWREVDQYADIALAGIEQLRDAARIWGAEALIPTAQRAIATSVRVVQHADDSNGSIGYVVDQLLALHAELCGDEPPPATKLVDWLIDFQFDGSQDLFTPDVAAYATALGAHGLELFEARVRSIQNRGLLQLAPGEWNHESLLVQHNLRRLAVARRDPQGVLDSFDDLSRSHQLQDAAKTLAEIGTIDLALEHARRGAETADGWQAERCAHYWCELLAAHGNHGDEVDARRWVFEHWSTASNAVSLARTMGDNWASIAEEAYARLAARSIRDLLETLLALGLDDRAWQAAQGEVLNADLWSRLVAVRETVDPASVQPMLRELIDSDLEVADARNYQSAVKRLKQLKRAMAAVEGSGGGAAEFAEIVDELRERHRRRPRFLDELRRARL